MFFRIEIHRIHELHDGGNRRIEIETAVQIRRDFRNRHMEAATQVFFVFGKRPRIRLRQLQIPPDNRPDATQETIRAFDALIAPRQIFFRRCGEEDKETRRIRAVFFKDFLRADDVSDGFRHLAAVFQDHPLAEQIREWLRRIQHAFVLQHFHKETRIEQVQNGVLDAADVLIDRHPIVSFFLGKRLGLIVRIAVANEIPGRIDEGVHRVRLAQGIRAALGTFAMQETFARLERRQCAGHKIDILGKPHGKLLLRHQHGTAMRTINHRNRAAPVALTGNEPIAQAIIHLFAPNPHLLKFFRDGPAPFRRCQPRKFTGIDQNAVVMIRVFHCLKRQIPRFVLDDELHRQIVFFRKRKVAFIMRRDGHDRARAVFVEDVICNPNRHTRARQRMNGVSTRKHPAFFRRLRCALDVVFVLHFIDESQDFLFVRIRFNQLLDDRMLRREHHVRHAVNRIDARRVDRDALLCPLDRERKFRPRRAPDPVLLHRLHALRPARQQLQIRQEAIRVIRDFQEPLRQILFDDFRLAAPAFPVLDLLIRQHRVATVAPIHLRFFFVGKPALVENLKQLLRVLIIILAARHDLAVPIVGKPQRFLLPRHIFDIRIRPFRGRRAVFNRGVFRRHPECVEAHRMKDIETLHFFETRHDVANRIIAHVSHVQIARRIRKHLQHVIFLLRRIFDRLESLRILPNLLPFLFDFLRNIFFHALTSLLSIVKTYLSL